MKTPSQFPLDAIEAYFNRINPLVEPLLHLFNSALHRIESRVKALTEFFNYSLGNPLVEPRRAEDGEHQCKHGDRGGKYGNALTHTAFRILESEVLDYPLSAKL